MSVRARKARRLATLLTKDSGTHVRVAYHRDVRPPRYVVEWRGGPPVEQMRCWRAHHRDEVPEDVLGDLVWERTEAGA